MKPAPVQVAFAASLSVTNPKQINRIYAGNLDNWIRQESMHSHIVQELTDIWTKSVSTGLEPDLDMFSRMATNYHEFARQAMLQFGEQAQAKLPPKPEYELEAALELSMLFNKVTKNVQLRYTISIYQYIQDQTTPTLYHKDLDIILMKTAHLSNKTKPTIFSSITA